MADEFGLECIDKEATDEKLRKLLAAGEHNRCIPLLCFANSNETFVRAEHRKFAGNYRLGRYWKRFTAPERKPEPVKPTPEMEERLSTELSHMGRRKKRIAELNEDTRAGGGVLATIYSDNGRHVRPQIRGNRIQHSPVPEVVEFAISYSADLSLIETIGRGFELKDHGKVALSFARCVLGASAQDLEQLPPRSFDLTALRSDSGLKTDPDHGIVSCGAIELTCRASPTGNLYTLRSEDGRLWARARRELGADAVRTLRRRPPLSAKIRTEWAASTDYPHGKVVTFDISAGGKERGGSCSLREKTRAERQLLNTYFDKWGFNGPAS